MRRLRDYGIYKLPGIKRAFYVVPAGKQTYFLYDCEFGSRLPPRFQIVENGNIVNWFNDMPIWTVDDLFDTEKTHQS